MQALKALLAFLKGVIEHNQTYTKHIPHPAVRKAYDKGRAFAHAITGVFK